MPAINNQPSVTGVHVNTTDATETTAASFTTRPNKAYGVVAKIVATETTDFDESAFYIRTALVENDGGTASVQGSVGTPTTIEVTGGWDATIDVDGDDIRVRVTGAAATNITWLVQLEVIEVGKYVANAGILE